LLYVIDTRTNAMQILQLYYAFSSRGVGDHWDAVETDRWVCFSGFGIVARAVYGLVVRGSVLWI